MMDAEGEAIPTTIEQAGGLIAAAAREGRGVVASGGMTKAGGAARGDRPRLRLRTTALNHVIDFSPGDLTITVEAGMTLRALDETLAPHGLRLPLDPPDYGGRATIGGILAFGDSGPIRLGYGGPREHVIGMSMVQGDGTLIRAGGRVVKNVAGYDLHRLFVGSHGSLGMIATASFKLRPRPEARRLVTAVCSSPDEAERVTAAILAGETRPVLLDWIRPAPRDWPGVSVPAGEEWRAVLVALGYEDCLEAAEWQSRQAAQELDGATLHDGPASDALYARLRARMVGGSAAFRASLPSSRVHEWFAAMPGGVQLHAHAGSGVVHGSIEACTAPSVYEMPHLEEAVAVEQQAPGEGRPALPYSRGSVQPTRTRSQSASALLKSTSDALGGALLMQSEEGSVMVRRQCDAATHELEKRLRRALDPAGVFPEPPFMSTGRSA